LGATRVCEGVDAARFFFDVTGGSLSENQNTTNKRGRAFARPR
jgi:hypothetical protein